LSSREGLRENLSERIKGDAAGKPIGEALNWILTVACLSKTPNSRNNICIGPETHPGQRQSITDFKNSC
jgi:hypothetical protein